MQCIKSAAFRLASRISYAISQRADRLYHSIMEVRGRDGPQSLAMLVWGKAVQIGKRILELSDPTQWRDLLAEPT